MRVEKAPPCSSSSLQHYVTRVKKSNLKEKKKRKKLVSHIIDTLTHGTNGAAYVSGLTVAALIKNILLQLDLVILKWVYFILMK